jgi:phage recombination protein Bet
MNQIAPKSTAVALSDVQVPAPARERGVEPHQWNALKQTVYPGASDQMILVAIDYCKARKLDPLAKPVHIVKTWDSQQRKEVEGIWPGINLHRTTAARTSEYAGKSEPIFGPEKTQQIGTRTITFPLWCKITVSRIVKGESRSFTGLVYWLEVYAAGKDGPNRMWTKRPHGQLAKCAEAEALRAAFPEETGGEPTAEEMEGQHVGPEHAKDVTPGPRPASNLDALEEIIGPNRTEPPAEAIDAETGEVTEGELPPAEPEPYDAAKEYDKLWDGAMAETKKGGRTQYWVMQREEGAAGYVLYEKAPDLYNELAKKITASIKDLPA